MLCYTLQYSDSLASPLLEASGCDLSDGPLYFLARIAEESYGPVAILPAVSDNAAQSKAGGESPRLICDADDWLRIRDLFLSKNLPFLDMMVAASWPKLGGADVTKPSGEHERAELTDYLGFFSTTGGSTAAVAVLQTSCDLRLRAWLVKKSPCPLEESPDRLVADAYGAFRKSAGAVDLAGSSARNLVVTVDSESSVFCTFPFGEFRQLPDSVFSMYEGVSVHISGRSLLAAVLAHECLRRDLADPLSFLQQFIVIINTYGFDDNSQCRRWETSNSTLRSLLRLTLEVLALVRTVYWQDMTCRNVQLRWYLNPSRAKLAEILGQPENRYVFAAFHVDEKAGEWMLSNGIRADWQTYSAQDFETRLSELGNNESDCYAEVEAGIDRLELGSIVLLRAFHCCSFGFGPGDPDGYCLSSFRDTIAGRLLSRGATQVEASYTKDYARPFLWYLLRFIYDNAVLWEMVEHNLATEDCQSLRDRVQAALEAEKHCQ